MRKHSLELINSIVAEYPYTDTKELAQKYGIPIYTCYQIASNRNVKKTPEVYAAMLQKTNENLLSSGKIHRFKKGHTSWNKGKYMRVSPPTEFKKGHKPHNYKPVGSERITVDGYLERKVADPKKWKAVHHIVWEEVNGPVPAKHKVIFLDNNKLNVSIDNLLCVNYKEAMLRNTIHRYPKEIVQAIKTISKLKKTIRNHGKEQD